MKIRLSELRELIYEEIDNVMNDISYSLNESYENLDFEDKLRLFINETVQEVVNEIGVGPKKRSKYYVQPVGDSYAIVNTKTGKVLKQRFKNKENAEKYAASTSASGNRLFDTKNLKKNWDASVAKKKDRRSMRKSSIGHIFKKDNY